MAKNSLFVVWQFIFYFGFSDLCGVVSRCCVFFFRSVVGMILQLGRYDKWFL
jgi:hypothetical protein